MFQMHLRDKDVLLVKAFTAELHQVKVMFEENQRNPPCHNNMPTVVSKVMWVAALIQRIKVIKMFIY